MKNKSAQWSIHSAAELLIQQWGDEGVVFDAYSGNTYLVDQMAAAILQYLETSPHSQEDVITHCADALGYEIDADFKSHTVSVLERLTGLNLLKCECQ